jgi:glycosyltransferase involved in cell wall biosynthesis
MVPSISIIIPTKNRCALLKQCLASIQAQTFEDWEAIVCDDGSTDRTAELVRELCDTDARIRWVPRDSKRPPGAPARRNDGLSLALGEYVIFLDDDDLLDTCCLHNRRHQMLSNEDLDFVIGQSQAFFSVPGDTDRFFNRRTTENDLIRFLAGDVVWPTQGGLWKTEAVRTIGGWREDLPRWQDWEFHIRALAAGLKYRHLDVADTYWRLSSSDSISSAKRSVSTLQQQIAVAALIRDQLENTYHSPELVRRILIPYAQKIVSMAMSLDGGGYGSRSVAKFAVSRKIISRTDHAVLCVSSYFICDITVLKKIGWIIMRIYFWRSRGLRALDLGRKGFATSVY